MVWIVYFKLGGEWFVYCIMFGFFCVFIEVLFEVSIFDVFFVYECGVMMGVYVFLFFGFNFLVFLIGGWFNEVYGWKWIMYFGVIFVVVVFIILFFFMEEIMYFCQGLEGLEDEQDEIVVVVIIIDVGEKGEKSSSLSQIVSEFFVVIYVKFIFFQKFVWFCKMDG